jgi:hypothetical protein
MRQIGLGAWSAVFVSMLCACGSSGEASTSSDASGDGPVIDALAGRGSDGGTGEGAAPDAFTSDATASDGSTSDASAFDGTGADGLAPDATISDGSAPDGTVADAASDGPVSDGPTLDSSLADAPTDGPLVMTSACDDTSLLSGCVVGQCTVSATGSPLPNGTSITLTQKPIPPDLQGDALGSVLCSIALPAGVQILPNLNLTIALGAAGASNSVVLFQYLSPDLSRIVQTSQSSASNVVGLVTAPGDFGATDRPGAWSVQGDLGIDTGSSADQASLLRNLSSQSMGGAYFDGTHLFACNGTRLLIYNGIPAAPGVKPDVVLGQPDLNTTSPQITSSLFGNSGCSGLWSDGTRLVAANGNRILIWNAIPATNAAPADIVLGQSDFTSNKANNGGVGASTLASAVTVDSDGTRLATAEIFNHRVLVWNTFPTTIGQPADVVVGQPDFTTNGVESGATPIYQAWGAVFVSQGMFLSGKFSPGLVHIASLAASNPPVDFTVLPITYKLQPPNVLLYPGPVARTPSGGLSVRDAQRIAMLKQIPTAPASVDFVLGQPDPSRIVSSVVSASVISTAGALSPGAGTVMLAPDSSRLLVFDTPPTFNFEPASRVIGQAGFTTQGQVDYRGISASTLAGPADVAVGGGMVAVADRGNNRVLLYRASDVAAGTVGATVVLGQPDSASYVANFDQKTPSAARMSGPAGVAIGGTHLIVADTENHRVLIWNAMPTVTGTAADVVLGQADFTGRRPNRGRGDADGDGNSDATADGFFYPMGVSSDGTHLFVADRLNNRVLVWNTFPTSSGQVADAVIGQPDFTSSRPNKSNGPFTFVPDGLNLPTGVSLVGTTLWIADTENNRVVRWDNATSAPAAGAFVGQASGSAVANANYYLLTDTAVGQAQTPATTAGSVLRPRSVAVAGGTLYVTESDSNRIHMLDASSFAPIGELGQRGDSAASSNANGIGGASLATPLGLATDGSTLWVADSANHRVLGYLVATTPSTGTAATVALGQPGVLTNGFNQTSTAGNGVTSQPRGLALANGQLYVADANNNRVLVMTTPIAAGQQPTRVYGQPNATLSLPNSGGAPSASTLAGPRGVFADSAHVIIADTGNNRVLVYDASAPGGTANLVLGQGGFTTSVANAGGASASTMQAPVTAYSDGTSLWVGDTGNHRVLVWKTFPTSNGQAADLVIGQASFSGVLPNQGAPGASASSLSFPAGIVAVHGVLYVADTGNNRVVSFSKAPAVSGAAADGVLGQPDLVSRAAAVSGDDLTHLSGPVAIAQDGDNLYVVDRDLGRVLEYTLGTIMSGSTAVLSIGTLGGLTLVGPQGIAAERTPLFTSRLYIGDTGDNQVVLVQAVTRLAVE